MRNLTLKFDHVISLGQELTLKTGLSDLTNNAKFSKLTLQKNE